ncbi:MAG: hypothetical protein KatS3mg087_2007 [Patescibacteria group bacterium]|nr:MAG: hypothetical protein KatS3mg087_2007 [Patescibacteria group bacterium]
MDERMADEIASVVVRIMSGIDVKTGKMKSNKDLIALNQ